MKYVFAQWLERSQQQVQDPALAPLVAIRDYFQGQHHEFIDIKQWDRCNRAVPGYIRTDNNHGTHFLVRRSVFKNELCEGHGVELTVAALKKAGLLIAHGRGKVLMVRMPGTRENRGRRYFYAIRDSIQFDDKEEQK